MYTKPQLRGSQEIWSCCKIDYFCHKTRLQMWPWVSFRPIFLSTCLKQLQIKVWFDPCTPFYLCTHIWYFAWMRKSACTFLKTLASPRFHMFIWEIKIFYFPYRRELRSSIWETLGKTFILSDRDAWRSVNNCVWFHNQGIAVFPPVYQVEWKHLSLIPSEYSSLLF